MGHLPARDYSHQEDKKAEVYERLEAEPMVFSFLEFEFIGILIELMRAIFFMDVCAGRKWNEQRRESPAPAGAARRAAHVVPCP